LKTQRSDELLLSGRRSRTRSGAPSRKGGVEGGVQVHRRVGGKLRGRSFRWPDSKGGESATRKKTTKNEKVVPLALRSLKRIG